MPTYRAYCRFRLIGWTAATGEVLFSVDLTNYAPGDTEESYSWLETAPGLVLTVHRERLYVTVLSTQVGSHSELSREGLSELSCLFQGHVVGDIRPILPDWCYGEDSVTMVEEVRVYCENMLLRTSQ